jgi:hypothetical protein
MIIVIRGTNGSGKSYAMRQILKKKSTIVLFAEEQSQVIRLAGVAQPILVIGPYTDGRSMGGCDCIRQPSKIYDLIMWAANRQYHALLEGVVLATKPYLRFYKDGHDVRYAFFDPPLAQCLANIRKRQAKKGQTVRVSRDAMQSKLNRAREMYADADWMGMIVKRFPDPSRDAVPWILKQLRDS